MQHIPQLTREEETELLRRVQKHGDTKAASKIVYAYLPWVKTVVSRNSSRLGITRDDFDDYVNEGVVGLYDAFLNYDATLGGFATYSRWWILAALRTKRMGTEQFSGQSPKTVRNRSILLHAQKQFHKKYGRMPSQAELVSLTGISQMKVARELGQMLQKFISVHTPLEGGSVFGDVIVDSSSFSPESHIIAAEEYETAKNYIPELIVRVERMFSARKADIFFRRNAIKYDSRQKLHIIAAEYSITRERVRQIVNDVWQKISRAEKRFTPVELKNARQKVLLLAELVD